jgi:DNA oxidative demethylase
MSGNGGATGDLLCGVERPAASVEILGTGAILLRRHAERELAALVEAVQHVADAAPFRHMVTPSGYRMSVAMTNCGGVGWVTDRGGYRYQPLDPMTGRPWPAMPDLFLRLAHGAAAQGGFADFAPDVCLVNRYEPGARLSLHQDKDEHDFDAPIVSVSLGLPTVFLFGGTRRSDRPRRLRLAAGDVVVWGGPSRLAFHGTAPLAEGEDALTGRCRINLTFRRAL